ncbi:MAG TPA: hypothetical protein VE913_00510 [Longimicrobium sp.]|nr:hypothetical protein [Longimicrobium sp.]
MKSQISRLLSGFALIALVSSAACRDAMDAGGANVGDSLNGLARGLHPVLVVADNGPITTYVDVRIKREKNTSEIASFQAELSYDTTQLGLVGGDFAPSVAGAWHEVSPGRVRFAGAAEQGMGDVPLVTLRFANKQIVENRTFGLGFQELVEANDFRDLTTELVARASPLVVSTYPQR